MPHGDAVDLKRLAALGKNLSEMPPRRPLSSAILHFLWQDLRGNSQARNAGSQFNAQDNQEQGTRDGGTRTRSHEAPESAAGSAGPATALIAACNC